MIYFMQSPDGGPVKIGYSGDVEARARQLESHYGKPLAVLATVPGDRAEEAEMHRRFAHLRLGRTEQFRPAPELMDFIGRPLLVGANPDAVEAIEPLATQVTLKGSPEWSQWLGELSTKLRTTKAGIIDRALTELAERSGFREPPER